MVCRLDLYTWLKLAMPILSLIMGSSKSMTGEKRGISNGIAPGDALGLELYRSHRNRSIWDNRYDRGFTGREPPRGVEPPTHALRMRCSTN